MSANTFTNITPTQAIKAWVGDGSDGSVLFYNGDLTTVLYLSNQTAPQLGSSVPIQPLTPAVLPAAQDWWALSAGPASVASLTVDPGGTYMAPSPAQVAQQISALGLATAVNQATQITHESNIDTNTGTIPANLPLLGTGIHLPVNAAQETGGNLATHTSLLSGTTAGALIGTAGNTVAKETAAMIASGSAAGTPGGVPLLHGVPAGSLFSISQTFTTNATSGSVPLSKIGYEGVLQLSTSVTTAPVYANVNLQWLNGSTVIADEIYYIQCGSIATPHELFVRGPSKGDHLNVTITAVGGNSVTALMTVFESSRQYAETDSWLDWGFFINTGGGTPATCDPSTGVLANIAISGLTPGSTNVYVLPIFRGAALLGVNAASAANALTVSLSTTETGLNGLIGGIIHPAMSDANYPFQLPSATCTLSVKNNGATGNVSPTVSLLAIPY